MAYDWSGERTRRLRLMRVATFIIVGLVVSVPLLIVTT
ncbi:4-amino-4-deoxy-L-arabinose transferase-like glycosyltransferase [Rhizobium binae]|uniref:4-amino-4-deoxy-L-arabinose transferase-like glycosyltransferase n=1 Tax=Rhizobium binae TaxID=1138190 RepID=A0ABV2MKB1_9HYPH